VIVGRLKAQQFKYAGESLLVASVILGRCAARTGQQRSHVIAKVGVEALFQCARRQAQSLPPGRHFDRLEIQLGDRLAA